MAGIQEQDHGHKPGKGSGDNDIGKKGATGPEQVEETENEQEASKLRWLMKLYFFHPFKWTRKSISVHFGKCALFLLQLIKVILITVMLFSFGRDREYFNEIVNRGHTALRNLFMEHWDASWETLPYPPAHGEFAVYEKHDMIDRINYAVERYRKIQTEAIGYFILPSDEKLVIHMKYFDFGGFGNDSADDLTIKELVFEAKEGLVVKDGEYKYNVTREFEHYNLSQPIKKLLSLTLTFTLQSVRVFAQEQSALCLYIKCWLKFSDLDNNGQVIEDLETRTTKVNCDKINVDVTNWDLQRTSKALAGAVLAFCVISFVFTVMTVVFAVYLYKRTKRFMKNNYKLFYKPSDESSETDLPFKQYFQFFKLWDLMCAGSDVATFYGTIELAFLKFQGTEFDISLLDSYTVCLSIGCLLAWFSILRYFKFHSKFHLLFTTVYMAIGDVIAYLICVGILFIGFWACGYIVLGPYNVKFSTPAAAYETLLSVVNGDEIFATIAILDRHPNSYIWTFARIYIWAYVAIFTIVVINLLVAIVLSSYDVIKEYYEKKEDEIEKASLRVNVPRTLKAFINENDENSNRCSIIMEFKHCCKKKKA